MKPAYHLDCRKITKAFYTQYFRFQAILLIAQLQIGKMSTLLLQFYLLTKKQIFILKTNKQKNPLLNQSCVSMKQDANYTAEMHQKSIPSQLKV